MLVVNSFNSNVRNWIALCSLWQGQFWNNAWWCISVGPSVSIVQDASFVPWDALTWEHFPHHWHLVWGTSSTGHLWIPCTKGQLWEAVLSSLKFLTVEWLVKRDTCADRLTVASFTKEVNPRLAKRPLVFNGRLANRDLTSLVKEATAERWSNVNGAKRYPDSKDPRLDVD